ncbi:hypothetical protein OOK44_35320 [Streptomyces cellulosae]|uniref:Uncharacterized protein n=1 Tax=Streptomyces althioticus TaxID=83380 RepID=A0ABZ1YG36_9ACTN|nr:hypothetical protein [Streptomyces cellulosae]WTB86448.1 hypothetical protein OG837_34785 [Streptomyces cellulosae]WTB93275.1 hypothetical protein OIE99_34070 [Streptomyces cellulosae]WTC60667.1 hypothetical protein OH715_35825 [Streptomyces cellulosae]
MPTSPPDQPVVQPVAAAPAVSRNLGAGEAAVVVAAITAVTVLAVLERPIPAVLTALVAGACLLLVPARAARLLCALTGSGHR